QRSNNELLRSKLQSQTIENQIALAVADAFLQIIFAQNQLNNFEVINKSTITQLDQAKKLYEAGATNQRQYLNLKAQDARDRMNIQNATGSIRMAYLRLKQLMQIETENFEIVAPKIDAVSVGSDWSVAGIINNAAATMPDIKLAETQVRSSELSIDIAKSAFYPRVAVFANVNTLYSESRLERFNPAKYTSPIGYVAGSNEPVLTEFTSYDTRVSAFGQQAKDNFGQAAGLSLSVPIFNNNQARASVTESKLLAKQAANNLERTRFSLRTDILQAYTDFENGLATYGSAVENEKAQSENYAFVLKSANAGVATTAEMILALNDWSQAKNDLERARFQLVYSRTILNFYNTGEVTISAN
ncbi:MAG: outer membrane protein, partial [Bacteroidia bacterium]